MSDLTYAAAIENIYTSIQADNTDLLQHIAALKAAMAREGLKEAVFDEKQRQLVVRDALQQSLTGLDEEIQQKLDLKSVERLGNKLAKTGLQNAPLIENVGPNDIPNARIKVATVHQVKGESLDAVLYLATKKEHVSAVLEGMNTEVGRIGYVAVTRARNLIWLGVPANAIQDLRPALTACGFADYKN